MPLLTNTMNEKFTNIPIRKNYNAYDSNKVIYNNNTNNKLIEGLGGDIKLHVYTLQLDLSKTISTISKNINIVLRFNKYNLIDIINLELLFGSANINNTNFSITCISDINNAKITIKSVRLVGAMTTTVFFSKKIPGLLYVYNSPNTVDPSNVDDNGWSTGIRLIEINGQYSIPEKLANVTQPVKNEQPSDEAESKSSAMTSEEASNSSGSYMVIIFVILLLLVLIGGGVYFFMKKKK